MKFGPQPLQNCLNAILAHGFSKDGLRLSKGTRLDQPTLDRLTELGVQSLTVATLEADDIDEDTAAQRLAEALCGDGIRVGRPVAGRCQLRSQSDGILHVPEALIHQINQLGWQITIATPKDRTLVRERSLVASIKLIPYAISEAELTTALRCIDGQTITLSPLHPHRVGLIVSQRGPHPPKWVDRAIQAQRTRLGTLSSHIDHIEYCTHRETDIADAIHTLTQKGCAPILFLGASAIADSNDHFPKAIESLGGRVIHVGMPVDPGNLLLLGQLSGTAVIGIPGCARALKPTGYDSVLQQVLCGVMPTAVDIQRMGVGGLMAAETANPTAKETPQPVALVMMAGQSQRMGPENKLLLPTGPQQLPMVRVVVQQLLAAGCEQILAVVGYGSADILNALEGLAVDFVENPTPEQGLSSSIRCGLNAIPDAESALIVLGDMPFVTVDSYQQLLAAAAQYPQSVIAPVFDGQRGNPVVFPRSAFDQLKSLEGDQGARMLLKRIGFRPLPLYDRGTLRDIDQPEDLSPEARHHTLRQSCPSLTQTVHGHPLIYFDHAATTPTPQAVLDRMTSAQVALNANVGRSAHWVAGQATQAVEKARQTVARFIHADSKGLILTSGTTESLNGLAQAVGTKDLCNTTILVNADDHHALFLPFQALADNYGAQLAHIPLTATGRIDLEALEQRLKAEKVALVVLSMASNVLGVVHPIKAIAQLVHRHGAKLIVDGAQVVAHRPVDVADLEVDAFVFGAHKVFGPMGVGALWVTPNWLDTLQPWKLGGGAFQEWSGHTPVLREIPHRFEAGTPNVPGILGFQAALDWLSDLGWDWIDHTEAVLKAHLRSGLGSVEGLTLLEPSPDLPLFSFVLDGIHAHDVGTLLDEVGIATRTGQHCASLLYQNRSLDAATRVSLSFLNTTAECDVLIDRLRFVHQLFHG